MSKGIPRYAHRRDKNEKGIVIGLRGIGAIVRYLSVKGLGDLLVFYRGHIFLLEIKTPTGKLTEAQLKERDTLGEYIQIARDLETATNIVCGVATQYLSEVYLLKNHYLKIAA